MARTKHETRTARQDHPVDATHRDNDCAPPEKERHAPMTRQVEGARGCASRPIGPRDDPTYADPTLALNLTAFDVGA